MLFGRDAHQGGELLSLCASREDDDFVRRIISDVLRRNDGIFADFKQPGLVSYLEICTYGATFRDNLLTKFFGSFNDTNHTFKLRRKGTDDKTPRDSLNDVLERLNDALLRNGEAVFLGIRGIGDEEDILIFADIAPRFCSRSLGIPSSWSSLRSPVMTTFPCGVSIEQPIESGIECVTGKNFTRVEPITTD